MASATASGGKASPEECPAGGAGGARCLRYRGVATAIWPRSDQPFVCGGCRLVLAEHNRGPCDLLRVRIGEITRGGQPLRRGGQFLREPCRQWLLSPFRHHPALGLVAWSIALGAAMSYAFGRRARHRPDRGGPGREP